MNFPPPGILGGAGGYGHVAAQPHAVRSNGRSMNCSEVLECGPLYLSGELEPARGAAFAAHLKTCVSCAAKIEQQRSLDARLRATAPAEEIASAPLENPIRQRIAVPRSRLGVIAASVAIGLLAIALLARVVFRVPTLYIEAAADHRLEIVDRQPRPWVTEAAGIFALADGQRIQSSTLQALTRDGYRLEKGKICRLDGQLFLHVVYTDGAREFSAYLRPRHEPGIGPMTTADVDNEHLAVVNGVHVTALFVANRADDAVSRARSCAGAL